MTALVGISLVILELNREDCRRHFETTALPMLQKQLQVFRPGLGKLKWEKREREDRTEWQPNGVPTQRTGYTFTRRSNFKKLEIELYGRYLEKYPREMHATISIIGDGKWVGNDFRSKVLADFGVAKPFIKPYLKAPYPSFPVVTQNGTSFRLYVGPLGSSLINGVSSVQNAQVTAIILLKR